MNNPNSGTPQQPGNAPPQGITQEYVAQLVVASNVFVYTKPSCFARTCWAASQTL